MVNASPIIGQATVTDGDTVLIGDIRIRLDGIDAPETDQICIDAHGRAYECGLSARAALQQLVGNGIMQCLGHETDNYGRRLMACSVDGRNVNAAMVEQGWALAYVQYSSAYIDQENGARADLAGLWDGAFIAPWDWRRRDRQTEVLGAVAVPTNSQSILLPQPGSQTPVPACDIKGNISRSGERIYHMPGMRDYEQTRINERDSERWFCSETEAQDAGWRRAQR